MRLSLVQTLILITLFITIFWVKPSSLNIFVNKVKQLLKTNKD